MFISTGGSLKDLSDDFSKSTANIRKQTEELDKNTEALKRNKAARTDSTGGTTGVAGVAANIPGGTIEAGVDGATKDLKNLGDVAGQAGGKFKLSGGKLKTFASNATQLVGSISLAINAGLLVVSAIEWIADALTTTSDEIIEKAQEAYDKTQKEIDKRTDLIASVEENIEVYNELSKKMHKSAEETDKLAKAAKALGDAAPGAILGYDSNGNPIIDVNAATSKASEVERELVEYGKEQIANIGELARGELKKKAEENYASTSAGKANKNAQTAGKVTAGAGGATLALAGFGAANGWNPAGWVALAGAGLLALGGIIFGVSNASEQAAVSQEQYNLALEKAAKISDENSARLLQNMSYITNGAIANRTFQGVSEKDRTTIASGMQKNYLDSRTGDLLNKLATKEIDEKEYEKQFKQLGDE